MSLIVCGIDEAGYGPLLGPLCVGMTAFRVEGWTPGDKAPNMWSLLSRAVCRSGTDKRGRIPIADSKRLKLANSSTKRHPLVHLERASLAALGQIGPAPMDDAALMEALGASFPGASWYGGEPTELPLGSTAAEIGIAANRLRGALDRAGIRILALRCEMVDEDRFNAIVRRTGTKGSTTLSAVVRHVREAWSRWGEGDDHLRIVCDRLGGRRTYENVMQKAVRDVEVETLEESGRSSRYGIDGQRVVVHFMPEAEDAHLPVALASMLAKLARELSMARFNRYWCERMPELKPTAGYRQDANRWLAEMKGHLSDADHEALVRIA